MSFDAGADGPLVAGGGYEVRVFFRGGGWVAQVWGESGYWVLGTYTGERMARRVCEAFVGSGPVEWDGIGVRPDHWYKRRELPRWERVRAGERLVRVIKWARKIPYGWQSRYWLRRGLGVPRELECNLSLGCFTELKYGKRGAEQVAVRVARAFDREWRVECGRTIGAVVEALKAGPAEERVPAGLVVPDRLAPLVAHPVARRVDAE